MQKANGHEIMPAQAGLAYALKRTFVWPSVFWRLRKFVMGDYKQETIRGLIKKASCFGGKRLEFLNSFSVTYVPISQDAK